MGQPICINIALTLYYSLHSFIETISLERVGKHGSPAGWTGQRGSTEVIAVNLRSWLGPRSRIAWSGLALAALLVLTTALGGCASFDPARISINLAPDQFTSIGW